MAEEPIPYEVVLPELEAALHRATSENVMLRARLAMRERELAALRETAVRAAPTIEQTFEEGAS